MKMNVGSTASLIILETFSFLLMKCLSSYEIHEYCLTEQFNATCDRDEVILMTSASYGRMRLGRCIRGDFNLGCSNDVIAYFDSQCSGRRSCEVAVRSLVDMKPCQRDFASYLEAGYKCISVLDLQFTGCPPEGRAITRFPSGYLSNNLYLPHSSLGRENCPWVVEARPGQRIQLSILSLHPSISESTTVCPRIVIVDSANVIQPESDFNVCIRRSRERQLYTSHGHQVIVHSTDGSTGSNLPSGHSAAKAKDKKFIIVYKVIGCPLLDVSDKAWVKVIGYYGDDVMIKCNETQETWYVSCQGNRWIGEFGNCSEAFVSSTNEIQIQRKWSVHLFTQGLVIALGLGLILGIVIAVVSLLSVCCIKHWCKNNSGSSGKAKPINFQVHDMAMAGDQLELNGCPSLLADLESAANQVSGLENIYVGRICLPDRRTEIFGSSDRTGYPGHLAMHPMDRHQSGHTNIDLPVHPENLGLRPFTVCERLKTCKKHGRMEEAGGEAPIAAGDTVAPAVRIASTRPTADPAENSHDESNSKHISHRNGDVLRYPPGLRTPEMKTCVI